jgi:hypothetical protein
MKINIQIAKKYNEMKLLGKETNKTHQKEIKRKGNKTKRKQTKQNQCNKIV